ncbi:MAG: general secretion pathway protein GspB, partial [Gammaproteobacteria bacterium]|nr:general secretion pathway protein GspB [Gammaproteobacteria bacterium]
PNGVGTPSGGIGASEVGGTSAGTDSAVAPRSPAPEPAATEARETAATPDPAPVAIDESSAPLSIAALAAADPSLPPLRLELLVYNADDPSRRAAFVNGVRYSEGERITGDLTLAEIRADGAILSHRGRRYLLAAR